MTTNLSGAIDEIATLFNSNVLSNSTAIIGYVPEIEWPGIDTGVCKDGSKFWLKFSTNNVFTEQETLCENIVINGSRRYNSQGFVSFQIFAPKRKDSYQKALSFSQMLQIVFRKSLPNVILRNSRIVELPPENGIVRFNVFADYEFDEIN